MNPSYYGYIRVSTTRQGEQGVSLAQQKESIERYAVQHGLDICRWFEEQQTAASRGRPVFGELLQLLETGGAAGVIIHKIDRSARNLRDWADLADLIDRGVRVHVAGEALDLDSRGGRLSADIQAVIAADYIRNLREEVKKGFYGRLKQGFYPMPAPLGYVDAGAGKPKTHDALAAPLVRSAFERYATGEYSMRRLADHLYDRGLRSKSGKKVTGKRLGEILHNPFYVGLIRIKKNGETYRGVHKPLVSPHLFNVVNQRFGRGGCPRPIARPCLFRQLVRCRLCGYCLIPEWQKGHVYYRCQRPDCPTTTIRESVLEEAILQLMRAVRITPELANRLRKEAECSMTSEIEHQQVMEQRLRSELAAHADRNDRLVDAYLDNALDKATYSQRKTTLELQRLHIEEQLRSLQADRKIVVAETESAFFLATNIVVLYKKSTLEERRELIQMITSNRLVERKDIDFTIREAFQALKEYPKTPYGGPDTHTARSIRELYRKMKEAVLNDKSDVFKRMVKFGPDYFNGKEKFAA